MSQRLSNATLAQLPAGVRQPAYDRNALTPGVVHLGLGAFHRSHQAPVFQALAEAGDMRWGVIGASLRSSAVHDVLAPQDFLYALAVDEGERREITIMNVIRDVIVAQERERHLVEAIAAPDTQIVTVTVTEKGYHFDAQDGPHRRRTMPEYLAAGLGMRRERGLSPLTIISCDNLAGNGGKLRAGVTEVARSHDPLLADWIERECAFPATMVDRIVPATLDTDVERMTADLGLIDRASVRTEAFWQWVIEDRFAGQRPDFESVGVQITSDISSWEKAKLRLLNGAHSAMAYLGMLAGISTVDGFVADDWGKAFLRVLWDEVQSTLEHAPEIDVAAYRQSLLYRFENEALGHRLQQIAMDGSQKIPQRFVGPAIDLIEAGRVPSAVALGIAAWIRFQSGQSDAGDLLEVHDPLASRTARLVSEATTSAQQAKALLGLESIFPRRLAGDADFVTLVTNHLEDLSRLGARATVERFVEVCI